MAVSALRVIPGLSIPCSESRNISDISNHHNYHCCSSLCSFSDFTISFISISISHPIVVPPFLKKRKIKKLSKETKKRRRECRNSKRRPVDLGKKRKSEKKQILRHMRVMHSVWRAKRRCQIHRSLLLFPVSYPYFVCLTIHSLFGNLFRISSHNPVRVENGRLVFFGKLVFTIYVL